MENRKKYGWGDTVGHFRNLKKSEKTERIRVGAFLWVNTVGFAGVYGGVIRWGAIADNTIPAKSQVV